MYKNHKDCIFGGKYKYQTAFTLAEVLITLVVIGIIAAVTIPIIYGEWQKEQTVTRLKKTYSDINRAVSLSIVENGNMAGWDFSLTNYNFFKKYLNKFMVMSDKNFLQEKASANVTYYKMSGELYDTHYASMQEQYKAHIINLADGAQLVFTDKINSTVTTNDEKVAFYVDINGYKKPNTFGKDLFYIQIWRDYGVTFQRTDNADSYETAKARTREQLKNGPSVHNYQCNKSGVGIWCGALIQADGWQIKKDYPW